MPNQCDNNVQDVEAYQEELSERLDDGGGCVEAWEALSENTDRSSISRRSMLRRAGTVTTGVALASSMQIAFTSTAIASEDTSREVLETVEEDDAFNSVKGRVHSELKATDSYLAKFDESLGEQFTFDDPVVSEVKIKDSTYHLTTHSETIQSRNEEVSVEVSSILHGKTVKQVKGLIRINSDGESSITSLSHDTTQLEQQSAVLKNNGVYRDNEVVTQQAQCIPCDADICYDTCVAVWGEVCNSGATDYCGYATTAACLIIAGLYSWAAGAVCAIFMEAVCQGDVGCYDTPENMCEDSSSACDDPWVN